MYVCTRIYNLILLHVSNYVYNNKPLLFYYYFYNKPLLLFVFCTGTEN